MGFDLKFKSIISLFRFAIRRSITSCVRIELMHILIRHPHCCMETKIYCRFSVLAAHDKCWNHLSAHFCFFPCSAGIFVNLGTPGYWTGTRAAFLLNLYTVLKMELPSVKKRKKKWRKWARPKPKFFFSSQTLLLQRLLLQFQVRFSNKSSIRPGNSETEETWTSKDYRLRFQLTLSSTEKKRGNDAPLNHSQCSSQLNMSQTIVGSWTNTHKP